MFVVYVLYCISLVLLYISDSECHLDQIENCLAI